MAKETKKRWDDESNEVESNFISFAVSDEDSDGEGDFIYGALLAPRREVPNRLAEKPGTMQFLYEVKVHECRYHKLDKKKKVIDEAIEPDAGETIILGGKAGFDHKLAHLKPGQLFGIKFMEEQESKTPGRNATKIFKVFLPKDSDGEFKMDESISVGADFDDFKSSKKDEEEDDED